MPTYVDPTAPDNTGDGSLASPKKYIDTVLRALKFAPDKVVRMRGGYCHDVEPGTTWNGGLDVLNARVEAYWLPGDEPGNPMIDGTNWLAPNSGGWSLEGPNDAATGFVWSYQLGTAQDVKRVFAGSYNNGQKLSQRYLGDGLRRAPDANFGSQTATLSTLASIKAHLNENDAWFGADATLTYKLYMWTPTNDKDPSQYHNGLGIAQAGAGTRGIGSAFSFFNARNFRVFNIDMRCVTAWPIQIAVTDNFATVTEDISFYRCNTIGSINGFRVSVNATAAYNVGARRIEFRECVSDTHSCAREQEPTQAYNKFSGQDQFFINGKCEDVLIVDCVGINPGHAGISIGAWDAVGARPARSGYLRHKVLAAPWTTYSRSLNMADCENTCFIEGCFFDGTNVIGQVAGSGRVIGNVFTNLRAAIRKPTGVLDPNDGWLAVACYRGVRGTAGVGDDNVIDTRPEGLLIANNSCDGSYGTPLQINIYSDAAGKSKTVPSIKDFSLTIVNNLLLDIKPGRAGKPYLTTYQDGALTLGTQIVENNAIYNGTETPSSAKVGATTYTNLNTAPWHKNNITTNPRVGADLRPLAKSPLARGGRFAGVIKDHIGVRFGVKPTIGAFEASSRIVRKPRNGA